MFSFASPVSLGASEMAKAHARPLHSIKCLVSMRKRDRILLALGEKYQDSVGSLEKDLSVFSFGIHFV